MIVSRLQKTNYSCGSKNSMYAKKELAQHKVSFCAGREITSIQTPFDPYFANDGISDLTPLSRQQGELFSPLQEYLEKEAMAAEGHVGSLGEIELPKIDIPDLPNLEFQDLVYYDDFEAIPSNVDKPIKAPKLLKQILLSVSIGIAVVGSIYLIAKKNEKYNNKIDKRV